MCLLGGCGGKGCAWCDPSKDREPDGHEPLTRQGDAPKENDNWLAWLLGR